MTKHWHSLLVNDELTNLLGSKPSFVYGMGHNLKYLFETSSKNKAIQSSVYSNKCGHCAQCKYISDERDIVLKNYNKTKIHPMRGNCNTEYLVYLAKCTSCFSFYIGKTEQHFRKRIYAHLHSTRKKDDKNAPAKHRPTRGDDHESRSSTLETTKMDPRGGNTKGKPAYRECHRQTPTDATTPPGPNDHTAAKPILDIQKCISEIL